MRKTIILLAALFSLSLTGCTTASSSFYRQDQVVLAQNRHIHAIVMKDGRRVVFDRDGGRYIPHAAGSDGIVSGITNDRSLAKIPSRDILEVEVQERDPDPFGTIALVSLSLIATGLFVFITSFRVH